MNVFRLVLCLVGLGVCVLVKWGSDLKERPWGNGGASPASLEGSLQPVLVLSRWEYGGKVVALRPGRAELSYEVRTEEGELLATNLTSSGLQEQFPELYAFMQTSKVMAATSPDQVPFPGAWPGQTQAGQP